jgi:MHS family proline/betaine transporter-like MFS transporter
VGLWLRLGVAESPSFLEASEAGQLADNPVAEAVRRDGLAIVMTFGLTALCSVGFYLPFVWLPTWLSHINKPLLPEKQALTSNTIALVALLLLTPLTGWISDKVGRRPMFLAASLGFALASYPAFVLMSAGTFTTAVLGGLVFAACSGLFAGCMAATFVELFPTRTRYSGVAIGYNAGQAILGGTAPLVATALIDFTGNDLSPAYYLAASGVATAVVSWFIPARHGRPLDKKA